METRLPPGLGWSATVIRAPRDQRQGGNGPIVAKSVESAGAVVVKRSYKIVAGALVPDGGGAAVLEADVVAHEIDNGIPYTRVAVESDLSPAKQFGDVIVLGGGGGGLVGGVKIGGEPWLERGPGVIPASDIDLSINLFGWQPRASVKRAADARPLTGVAEATDRLDAHYNSQRRTDKVVSRSHQAALPATALVGVWNAVAGGTALASFTYAPKPLHARLFKHDGNCADRETRWCREPPRPLMLDTLIVRLVGATVSLVWRASWPWTQAHAAALRRIVIVEETA